MDATLALQLMVQPGDTLTVDSIEYDTPRHYTAVHATNEDGSTVVRDAAGRVSALHAGEVQSVLRDGFAVWSAR